MLTDLMASRADNTLPMKLKAYTAPDILLIDELGFERLEQEEARNASLFFKVIDGRYCKGSTLITTNIDFKELGDYLGDPVVTTAIVDRMVHHSIIITIEGPSWRMHESSSTPGAHRSHNLDPPRGSLWLPGSRGFRVGGIGMCAPGPPIPNGHGHQSAQFAGLAEHRTGQAGGNGIRPARQAGE